MVVDPRTPTMNGFVAGLPHHKQIMVDLLRQQGCLVTRKPGFKGDFLYHIFGIPDYHNMELLGSLLFYALRRKLVIHWVGSDVLAYARAIRGDIPRVKSTLTALFLKPLYNMAANLAGAPWLVSELADLGINALYMPFPAKLYSGETPPLPERPTFLSYVPKGREDFYGWDIIREVARLLPDYRWLILKHDGVGLETFENVRFLGDVPSSLMPSTYRQSSCFVRLTRHDGLSLSVLESLSHGRYVVWTYEFPGCFRAERNVESVVGALRLAAAERKPNTEGRMFVAREFDEKRLASNICAFLKSMRCGNG